MIINYTINDLNATLCLSFYLNSLVKIQLITTLFPEHCFKNVVSTKTKQKKNRNQRPSNKSLSIELKRRAKSFHSLSATQNFVPSINI